MFDDTLTFQAALATAVIYLLQNFKGLVGSRRMTIVVRTLSYLSAVITGLLASAGVSFTSTGNLAVGGHVELDYPAYTHMVASVIKQLMMHEGGYELLRAKKTLDANRKGSTL